MPRRISMLALPGLAPEKAGRAFTFYFCPRAIWYILAAYLSAIMSMKIRLFIKPHCPWCHKAIAWLNERGLQHETLNILTDSKALTEMVNLSGQRFVPVIDVDGKILADFGPEELEKFWKQF
jgi:glutaredoxin